MAEATELQSLICSNPDCRVAETGKCVEGLERDACPHFGRTPVEKAGQLHAEPEIGLRSADRLSRDVASAMLRRSVARVVAIIGPFGAGKTSLIGSVYELFQLGPIGDVAFAGSATLHALERECHDARAASRRIEPTIQHTPHGEVQFYHLQVAGGLAGAGAALLLGDRAGENYLSTTDNPTLAETLIEVQRADSLTVLIDGERLMSTGTRHSVMSEVRLMLRALCEGAVVPHGKGLALVLTKLDAVKANARAAGTDADFERLCAEVKGSHAASFFTIQSFKVAASPKIDGVTRGEGVAELVRYWLGPLPQPHWHAPRRERANRSFAWLQPTAEPEDRP